VHRVSRRGSRVDEPIAYRGEGILSLLAEARFDYLLDRPEGKTKATEYFVEPQVLRTLEFQGETTLKGIERHRLRELILRDLEIYRKASISQIHGRIGKEIPRRKLQHELKLMVQASNIGMQGQRKHAVYLCTKPS
jgi:ATP-dependent DNA helicase RecG